MEQEKQMVLKDIAWFEEEKTMALIERHEAYSEGDKAAYDEAQKAIRGLNYDIRILKESYLKEAKTYREFLGVNGLQDSMESYTRYIEENDTVYKWLRSSMRNQYIRRNYQYRFIKSAWM